MKQRLKYFFILIYPYWIFPGYLYWGNFDLNIVFILFSISWPIIYIAALISSINLFILSLKNELNTHNLALRNFIYKLLHVFPLYTIFFYTAASGGYQPHDMEDAFNFALVLLLLLILITSLLGITTIIASVKKRRYSKFMITIFIILGFCQFIFIIDVFAAFILLIITLIAARKDKQNLDEIQGAA